MRRLFNTLTLARALWRGWPDPHRRQRAAINRGEYPPPEDYDPRADYDLIDALRCAWEVA